MDVCCNKDSALAVLQIRQRRTLIAVLAINAAMFVAIVAAAGLSKSSALLSNSLDNLGDALTYAQSLGGRPWRAHQGARGNVQGYPDPGFGGCRRGADRLAAAASGSADRADLHPIESGRVYAAYGGVYVAVALVWLWKIDRVPVTTWDLAGAAVALAGMGIIVWGGWRT